jgi:multimeric flavodoxin WrbA
MTSPLKTLLIVSHSPSDNTRLLSSRLYQSACSANSDNVSINIQQREALQTTSEDVLAADAIILMTPENLGYMSGGMKDFFDRVYYPCLEEKQGLPVCAVIRAGQDGTGTKRALETITTGLKWRWVQEPLILRGDWQPDFIRQGEELALAMAIALQEGMI